MRRFTILAVLIGIAIAVTTATALAGWWWNAKINVDGTVVRTMWCVGDCDDADWNAEDQGDYTAVIKVFHPKDSDVSIVEQADNEKVVLKGVGKLHSEDDATPIVVKYHIRGKGHESVSVKLVAIGDPDDPEDDQVLAEGSGRLNKPIRLSAEVPH